MNGYFQLVCSPEMTAIKLVPPTNGGAGLDVNEIIAYLKTQGIYDADTTEMYSALRNFTEEKVVRIANPTGYMIRESLQVRCTEDKMQIFGRFYPPAVGGERMPASEIIQDLQVKGVRAGIDQQAITAFVQNPEYCTDIVLARGIEPEQGQDAIIEYTFNTEISMRPARNPDGSVDFFNLNTICHCKKGDVLAKLTREVKGKAGCNVFGERLLPREVKSKRLKFSHNIELSEDENTITSMIDGHVSLVGDKVFVSDVYEVENVGPSTGNVVSEGSVHVNGNIQAGYSVKAKGNVIVNGVVEGATVEADGDIILARGMNGMGKGVLKAGGSIISKFFENSTIESGSYIEADSILHSNVVAQTEVNVDGRKGFIVGGCVRAFEKVSCKTLGSPMGTDTFIEVGVDPAQKQRYQELRKQILDIEKKLKQIQPVLVGMNQKIKAGAKLTPEQLKYLQSMAEANKTLTDQLFECEEEYDLLDEHMQGTENACVLVKEDVYGGTKITIMDASIVLRESMSYCRFMYDKGDVRPFAY